MEQNTMVELEEQVQALNTELQAALARIQQQVRQAETINRIVQVIGQLVALDEVLQTTVDLLPETLQVNRCLIWRSQEEDSVYICLLLRNTRGRGGEWERRRSFSSVSFMHKEWEKRL